MQCFSIDIPANKATLLLGRMDVNESYFGAKHHRSDNGFALEEHCHI
jgi:hypothetical protein